MDSEESREAFHLAGDRLGKFVILGELGRGAMGVVYEALQTDLKRKVALKILPANISLAAKHVRRFHREAESVARLRHEGIIQIHEVGEIDRTHYFSMELVDGRPFGDPPARDRDAVREAARLARDAARALHHAHERGVIHRDIKPGNLLVDRTGRVVVTDFGLAHLDDSASLTSTDAIVGTPKYMSPEQILPGKRPLDGRSDVYSLGATLYEVICGRPPLEEPTVQAFLRAVLEQRPASPRRYNRDVPHDLATIVLRCLEKDPDERYADAGALADDLDRFLAGERIHAKAKGLLARGTELVRRHKVITALSAVAGLAIVVVMLVTASASEAVREGNLRKTIMELSRLAQAELDYAIEQAEELHRQYPANEEIAVWRADFYQRRARRRLERPAGELNRAGVIRDLEQAGMAGCRWHLQMLIEEGRLDEARRIAERLPADEPSERIARDLALARLAIEEERWAEAEELVVPLLDLDPDDPLIAWVASRACRGLAGNAPSGSEPQARADELLRRAFDLSLGIPEQWLRERILSQYVASREGATVRLADLLPRFGGVARETLDRLTDLWLGMTESEAENVRVFVASILRLAEADELEPEELAATARERLARADGPRATAIGHLLLAVFHLGEGLPELARADLARAEDACFGEGGESLLPYVLWGRSLAERARGDLEAAIDHATMAIEFAGALDGFEDLRPLATHATLLAEEARTRSRPEEVRDVAGVLDGLERGADEPSRAWITGLLERLRGGASR